MAVAVSCSSAVRIVAAQPPRRRVDGSGRLVLVVEAAQALLLPIAVDLSIPLLVLLVPAHAHVLRRCHTFLPPLLRHWLAVFLLARLDLIVAWDRPHVFRHGTPSLQRCCSCSDQPNWSRQSSEISNSLIVVLDGGMLLIAAVCGPRLLRRLLLDVA
jgi:hypothetical protein